MTTSDESWAGQITPDTTVHNPPASTSNKTPSRGKIKALGNLAFGTFAGTIAIALSGISVLGIEPLAFLRKWGEDRITEAQNAYLKATDAQDSANDAVDQAQENSNRIGGLDEWLKSLEAKFAVHDRKIADMAMQLNTAGEETGGTDPCDDTAKVVNVLGTVHASVYGWWFSPSDPASFLYNPTLGTPTREHVKTDRHGVGAVITSKQPGVARIDMACNATKTNGASLQIKVNNWRKDEISVGYLTGPNSFVAVKTIKQELPKDSVWQIWYHPGDPDDPADPWANTFFVMLNSDEVRDLRWTDGGNFVQHGEDFRWTGGCCNADDDFFSRGPAITEFAYYDYLKAVPE